MSNGCSWQCDCCGKKSGELHELGRREFPGSAEVTRVTKDQRYERERPSHFCDGADGNHMMRSRRKRGAVKFMPRASTAGYVSDVWFGVTLWLDEGKLGNELREE